MGLLDYLYGSRDTGQPLLDGSGVDSVGNPLFMDPAMSAEGKRRFLEALATMPTVEAIKSGITAPRDAYEGKFDPTSEEGTKRALDMAGLAMTGGIAGTAAGAVPREAVGIFGGKLAKTADHAALAKAEELAAGGADKRVIWDTTGWFQGADGKWRFEIPDNAATFNAGAATAETPSRIKLAQQHFSETLGVPAQKFMTGQFPEEQAKAFALADADLARGVGGSTQPMQQVLSHDALYAAYPDLANVPTMRENRGIGHRGTFDGDAISYGGSQHLLDKGGEERSTLLHELQHAVQGQEGMARGANNFGLKPGTPAWDIYQERLQAIRTPMSEAEFQSSAVGAHPDEYPYSEYLKQHKDSLKKNAAMLDRAAQDTAVQQAYQRSAGEVEARNVQARRDLTPEERAARPPWETQDVPDAQQIVRFRQDGPQMSMPLLDRPATGQPLLDAGSPGPMRPPELPMDYHSRMTRAERQGFDPETQWYHGTREDIQSFDPSRPVYVTDDPAQASAYAEGAHLGGSGSSGPNVMPLVMRKGEVPNIDGIIMEAMDRGLSPDAAIRLGLQQARKSGAVAVEYSHPNAGGSGEHTVRVALNPDKNLRSEAAAFDPANEGSGMLLGSGSTDRKGAAATGMALLDGAEPTQPLLRAPMRQTVYRVVPDDVPEAEAFRPRTGGGTYVFADPKEAKSFQSVLGGKIVQAEIEPHKPRYVDDFSIEHIGYRPMKKNAPAVFANDGGSDLYPKGAQLFVRDTNLIDPTTARILDDIR